MAVSALRRAATLVAALLLFAGAAPAQAQQADTTARRQQRTLDSLAAVVRSLQARLDSLHRLRAPGDTTGNAELEALRAAAAAASADSQAAAAEPRQARLGLNALNPEISVTAIVHAAVVRPGPQTESFDAKEFEFSFQSALDPYSYTKIFLSVTPEEIEVEEGYAYWAGLPGHTRLDVGRFRQPLGELNRWHRHALPEGELPLVHLLYLGGAEGLSGTGVSLYAPLPFSGRLGTFEWYGQVTRGTNEGLFLGGDRAALLSALNGFWQLTRSTYAMLGVSGVYATNALTFWQSEFVYLRAEWTHRRDTLAPTTDRLSLHAVWAMGPHKHEIF